LIIHERDSDAVQTTPQQRRRPTATWQDDDVDIKPELVSKVINQFAETYFA
jgi:hypothetical protein